MYLSFYRISVLSVAVDDRFTTLDYLRFFPDCFLSFVL